MISQQIITNAVTILQVAYTAAGSACVVLTDFPLPWQEFQTPVLIVSEGGGEHDVLIGPGGAWRGTPGPPPYQYAPDYLLLEYRLPSINQQNGATTYPQALVTRRNDKMVMATIFKNPPIAALSGHNPLTLDGACMEAGKSLDTIPQYGPYKHGDTQGTVILFWQMRVSIRLSNH